MMTRICVQLALMAALGLSGTAQAALQGRDLDGNAATFEAYYDTDLNITWLATANNTGMYWSQANAWAANLSLTDGVHVYDNWRLPTTLQPDGTCSGQSGVESYGYGCTGSEMGHLFYSELGGTVGQSILNSSDPNLAKFANLQAYYYWSATERVLNNGSDAWDFDFFYGDQHPVYKATGFYALAVSPGDVTAVPEADTWAMLLAGLGLVGAVTRRRRG